MVHSCLLESCKGSVRGWRLIGAGRVLPISSVLRSEGRKGDYGYCNSDLQGLSSEILSSVSPSWRDSQTGNKRVLPLLCQSRRSKRIQQTSERAAFTSSSVFLKAVSVMSHNTQLGGQQRISPRARTSRRTEGVTGKSSAPLQFWRSNLATV